MNTINKFTSSFGEKFLLIFITSLVNFLFYFIVVSIEEKNLEFKVKKEHIQKQLDEFYFPLQQVLQKSETVWFDYQKRYRNKKKSLLTSDDIDSWQKYMLVVFQPIHVELEMILKKSHLSVPSKKIKSEIAILIKHLHQYKVLFSQWDNKNDKKIFAPTNFPKKLLTVVNLDIKNLQRELL